MQNDTFLPDCAMDAIVERLRALIAQDEADMERSRAQRLRHSWLRRLCRPLASADC